MWQNCVLDMQSHIIGVIKRQLEGFGSWEGDNKHSWLFGRQCGFVTEVHWLNAKTVKQGESKGLTIPSASS